MKIKKKNILYYLALAMTIILRMCTSSKLFKVMPELNQITIIIIVLLFSMKIILDKHTFKELFLIMISAAVFIYMYLILDLAFFVIGFFAFIAIKDVEIKKIIKLDLIIKCIFIISHALLYGLNYLLDVEKIIPLIMYSKKGISHTLFFLNPNTLGMLMFWLILDIEMLRKKDNNKKYILYTLIIIITFLITKCRTALYSYVVYFTISLIKNKKVIDLMNKYIYIILAGISFVIINFVTEDSSNFLYYNGILSGRLSYSIRAFNILKLHLLPYFVSDDFYRIYIIDNYYVKCFINYGIITMILFYIPYIVIPVKKFLKEKKIFIISAISLFFETMAINVGYAVPYLIMADIIFNKKGEIIQ